MFRYNVALTLLNLDHNHITVIDGHAFRGVPKLRELRLQNNSLRKITREHFASLTSLTELYLQVSFPGNFVVVSNYI
jgi:Leucine-rich repeat (LRR) protein